MQVKIYGIGGANNDRFMGTAHDPETGLSLIYLLAKEDASGCSLHGCLQDGAPELSGEFSLLEARRLFAPLVGSQVWIVSVHTGENVATQSKMLKAFLKKEEAEAFRDELMCELRLRGQSEAFLAPPDRTDSVFHGLVVDYTGATVSVSGALPLHK